MSRKTEQSDPLTLTADPNSTLIRVAGGLTFASVVAGIDAFKPFCTPGQGTPLILDFTETTHMDSAGLALLLQWKRMAHAVGRSIQFHALPDQTRNLAAVFGLTNLLDPVSTS
ncbi:MAG: STAS domain-containing protein [Candidatus Macondimonas sp.]|jgi:anti-anti-sigma factor